jgi:hypothetical protein
MGDSRLLGGLSSQVVNRVVKAGFCRLEGLIQKYERFQDADGAESSTRCCACQQLVMLELSS